VIKAGDGTTAIVGISAIASCGITGTTYATITSITCNTGFLVTTLASDTTKIVGCTTCESGNEANYKSCTGTMPATYIAATITAAVCADGFFHSDAKTCKACGATATLKAADGSSTIYG